MTQLDCRQRIATCGGRLRHHTGDELQRLISVVGKAPLAREGTESVECQRRDRVRRRRCVVHQILLAHDQGFGVVGCGEHSARVGVPKVIEEYVGNIACLGNPACLAGCLRKSREGIDEVGMIGGERGVTSMWRAIGLPRAMPATFWRAQFAEEKLGVGHSGLQPILAAHRRTCLGESREEQRVPLGEHLVVEARPRPTCAGFEEQLSGLLDVAGPDQLGAMMHPAQDVAPFKVALLGDLVPFVGNSAKIGTEDLADLRCGPGIERTLMRMTRAVK